MGNYIARPMRLDDYFDKIFYINLAQDVARNEHMISQFEKHGIKNYERFEAIQITKLPAPELYRNFIKSDLKYVLGSLSCRASHVACIKIAKERNYKRVLIFEDDIIFTVDPNALLTQNQTMLDDWDMLYFSGLVEPHFRNQVVGAYANAVRSTLFDNILCMADTSGMEVDNFYAKILQHMSYNYNQSGKYNIRVLLPFNSVVVNKLFPSNIQRYFF